MKKNSTKLSDYDIALVAMTLIFGLIGAHFLDFLRIGLKNLPPDYSSKTKNTRPIDPQKVKEDSSKKTKPVKKYEFRKVRGVSKGLDTHQKPLGSQKELNTLSKTWVHASQKIKDINFTSHTANHSYNTLQNRTRRFPIKIEFPEPHRGLKFKLQYRQPPKFGEKKSVQPRFLQAKTSEQAVFSIEKSVTSESPWNTFSNNPLLNN